MYHTDTDTDKDPNNQGAHRPMLFGTGSDYSHCAADDFSEEAVTAR